MCAALEVRDLRAGYDGSQVLTGFSCAVSTGEVVALLGRNGMGKSTAVAAIAGTLPSTSGSVWIEDRGVTRRQPASRYSTGLRTIRQTQPVFAGLSILENLALVGCKNIQLAADYFGFLTGRGRQAAGTLSGGEQKMLAMARVAADPGSVWALDEPTEGLQPANVDRCAQIISDAARNGVAVLLVEQHLAMALKISKRWAVLERGRVVEEGVVTDDSKTTIQRRMTI